MSTFFTASSGASAHYLDFSLLRQKYSRDIWPQDILDQISFSAKNPELPVWIQGETGTGKELVAKRIRMARERVTGTLPFVAVNCANLTGTLVASLLFGHKRGAFTGADESRRGYVAEADGGILFLDEIQALPLDSQKRLLRVFNDGTFTPVGSVEEHRTEFQVIVASSKNIDKQIDNGKFLVDLRTRLTGCEFALKPLRERQDEMDLLIANHFAQKDAKIEHKSFQKLVERCQSYYWQGNIRLLHKALDVLVLHCRYHGLDISAEHLPEYASMFAPNEPNLTTSAPSAGFNQDAVISLVKRALHEDLPLTRTLEEVEKAILAAAMKRHRKCTSVYERLKVPRTSFFVKRKRYFL